MLEQVGVSKQVMEKIKEQMELQVQNILTENLLLSATAYEKYKKEEKYII